MCFLSFVILKFWAKLKFLHILFVICFNIYFPTIFFVFIQLIPMIFCWNILSMVWNKYTPIDFVRYSNYSSLVSCWRGLPDSACNVVLLYEVAVFFLGLPLNANCEAACSRKTGRHQLYSTYGYWRRGRHDTFKRQYAQQLLYNFPKKYCLLM